MLLVVAKIATAAGSAGLLYGITAPTSDQALSVYNLALLVVLIGGVLAYVIAQVRDYKPNKRLRDDNNDLRNDLDALQKRFDDLQTRFKELAAENDKLKQSRDFDQAIGELRAELLKAIGDLRKETT